MGAPGGIMSLFIPSNGNGESSGGASGAPLSCDLPERQRPLVDASTAALDPPERRVAVHAH